MDRTPTKFGTRRGLKKIDTGIRKVAPTYGKNVFLTHSEKASGVVALESNAERLVAHLLCIDPGVRSFRPQPFTIDVWGGAILRTEEEKQAARLVYRGSEERPSFYTPDFLAGWHEGTETAFEVKAEDYQGDEAYNHKLRQASRVLWDHGIRFMHLVVPSYWRHPLLSSAPLLYQAAARKDLRPSSAVIARVEQLADEGVNTLGGFCKGVDMDARMGPVLIAFGVLRVDIMAHILRDDTPASPAYGDLSHLSLLERLAS
jgi:hypothetical protein